MGVRALGVNHVAFEVQDLDEALAWYERYFEFELRGRRGGMAWIDLGDQFLALSERSGSAPDHDRHVGLVVDDKEALRRLRREPDPRSSATRESLRQRAPIGRLGPGRSHESTKPAEFGRWGPEACANTNPRSPTPGVDAWSTLLRGKVP